MQQSGGKPSLPHGWIECISKTYPDRVYYYNIESRVATWIMPQLDDQDNRSSMHQHNQMQIPEPEGPPELMVNPQQYNVHYQQQQQQNTMYQPLQHIFQQNPLLQINPWALLQSTLGSFNSTGFVNHMSGQPGIRTLNSISGQQGAAPMNSLSVQPVAGQMNSISGQPSAAPMNSMCGQPVAGQMNSISGQPGAAPMNSMSGQSVAGKMNSISVQPGVAPMNSMSGQSVAGKMNSISVQPGVAPMNSMSGEPVAGQMNSISGQLSAGPINSISGQLSAGPINSISGQPGAGIINSMSGQPGTEKLNSVFRQPGAGTLNNAVQTGTEILDAPIVMNSRNANWPGISKQDSRKHCRSSVSGLIGKSKNRCPGNIVRAGKVLLKRLDLRHKLSAKRNILHKQKEAEESSESLPRKTPTQASAVGALRQRQRRCGKLSRHVDAIDLSYLRSLASENTTNTIWFIVPDTNVLISDLKFVKAIADNGEKDCYILIPYQVLVELDASCHSRASVSRHVICRRIARRYLNHKFNANNTNVIGQSVFDAHKSLFEEKVSDDNILNCCLQRYNAGYHVVLLSNDINLCNKAVVNGIRAFTVQQMHDYINQQKRASCSNTNADQKSAYNRQKVMKADQHTTVADSNLEQIAETEESNEWNLRERQQNNMINNSNTCNKRDKWRKVENTAEPVKTFDLTYNSITRRYKPNLQASGNTQDSNDNQLTASQSNGSEAPDVECRDKYNLKITRTFNNNMTQPYIVSDVTLQQLPHNNSNTECNTTRQRDTAEREDESYVHDDRVEYPMACRDKKESSYCIVTLRQIMEDLLTTFLWYNDRWMLNTMELAPWELSNTVNIMTCLYEEQHASEPLYKNIDSITQTPDYEVEGADGVFVRLMNLCQQLLQQLEDAISHPDWSSCIRDARQNMEIIASERLAYKDILAQMDEEQTTLTDGCNSDELERRSVVPTPGSRNSYVQTYLDQHAHYWEYDEVYEDQADLASDSTDQASDFEDLVDAVTSSTIDSNNNNVDIVVKLLTTLKITFLHVYNYCGRLCTQKGLKIKHDQQSNILTDVCETETEDKTPHQMLNIVKQLLACLDRCESSDVNITELDECLMQLSPGQVSWYCSDSLVLRALDSTKHLLQPLVNNFKVLYSTLTSLVQLEQTAE